MKYGMKQATNQELTQGSRNSFSHGRFWLVLCVCAGVAVFLFAQESIAQSFWPLQPIHVDHPLGTTFGEYKSHRQHRGVDILGRPKYTSPVGGEDPTAPWVQVTAAGWAFGLKDDPGTRFNEVLIHGEDGHVYRYTHLEHKSFHPTFLYYHFHRMRIPAGTPIAKLVWWTDCTPGFHHVHYEVSDSTESTYFDPLGPSLIGIDVDDNPPQIEAIHLARDDGTMARWTEFDPVSTGACPKVDGPADIVVQARDRNAATWDYHVGTKTLWVRRIRWRACPESDPDCAWQDGLDLGRAPKSWFDPMSSATAASFSTEGSWVSDGNYCFETWLYGIVTNVDSGGNPNPMGNWNPLTSGTYTLSVELRDSAGNKTIASRRACVELGASPCITELTIRDGEGDDGSLPFRGSHSWRSPAIELNPGTPHAGRVIPGAMNTVTVRVENLGTCPLALGTAYKVNLATSPLTTYLPPDVAPVPPIPSSFTSKPEIVSGPAWIPGEHRISTFNWLAPGEPTTLAAWVSPAGDPVLDAPGVTWDDNRAMKNVPVRVTPAAAPGTSLVHFWIYPISPATFATRNLLLRFDPDAGGATLENVRLHIGPGLRFDGVLGASFLGGYPYATAIPSGWVAATNICQNSALTQAQIESNSCSRVWSEINPVGHVYLRNVRVSGIVPVRLTIEVSAKPGVAPGRQTVMTVIEDGQIKAGGMKAEFGGLTVHFEQP